MSVVVTFEAGSRQTGSGFGDANIFHSIYSDAEHFIFSSTETIICCNGLTYINADRISTAALTPTHIKYI